MQFLDTLNSFTPLALVPDRPASEYMLSFDDVVYEQTSQQLKQQKEREQLNQIDKLSEIIRRKERELADQENKQLQRHLLYEIQIDRLRRILQQWDTQRRRYQEDIKTKERIYQAKLQEVKTQLSTHFNQQIDIIRGENKLDLDRIKELYDIRVAKLHQETFKQEHRMKVLQMENQSLRNRMRISQGERQSLQAALMLKEDTLNSLEKQIKDYQTQLRKWKEENSMLRQGHQRDLELISMQNQSKLGEYEDMKSLIMVQQNTIEDLRTKQTQSNDIKQRMQAKIESLEIRCQALQKQMEQLRKTQHNATHNLSEKQQLSGGMKDSRSVAKIKRIGETIEKVNLESDHENSKELERIADLQEQLSRKNEDLRQANILEEDMSKELEEKDKELAKTKQMIGEYQMKITELQAKVNQLMAKVSEQQAKLSQKQAQTQKIQADSQKTSGQYTTDQRLNDGGKMQKIWLQRLQKSQEALQLLSQQWSKRERELAGLFKKIDTTYKLQLQKDKQTEQQLRKENQSLSQLLEVKIKELSMRK